MRITFYFLLVALLCTILTTACGTFSNLFSTTQIEPSKSFVLGEGKHGSYQAKIKNISQTDVEVFKSGKNDTLISLGMLSPNATQQYDVPSNTKVVFKNVGNKLVRLEIKLEGDTGLSMGYKDNN